MLAWQGDPGFLRAALDPAEQVFLGELVAQNLSHLDRVASVVPPASAPGSMPP